MLTPGMGDHGMDATPQAIHYTMSRERMPRSEEPLAPFSPKEVRPNKKGQNPRDMAIFPPSSANVGKIETVRELLPREEISRKLSFERPVLADVLGRITERIGGRAREIGHIHERPEAQLQDAGCPRRHAKPTRAHTKNLLEREIVRALDKKYTEGKCQRGETREYPAPEKLERMVAKKTRTVLGQTMPANNPVRKASKELSGRSFGDGVTHGTITKKLLSTAFRRADEAKSREKEERNEVRELKEGAFAAQFLETEEDLYAEAALLAEEKLLWEEERKSDELPSLFTPKCAIRKHGRAESESQS